MQVLASYQRMKSFHFWSQTLENFFSQQEQCMENGYLCLFSYLMLGNFWVLPLRDSNLHRAFLRFIDYRIVQISHINRCLDSAALRSFSSLILWVEHRFDQWLHLLIDYFLEWTRRVVLLLIWLVFTSNLPSFSILLLLFLFYAVPSILCTLRELLSLLHLSAFLFRKRLRSFHETLQGTHLQSPLRRFIL